jgi:hypothetical protein
MTGNSNDRKKALIISMLLFLVSGGGIFLFFVVQGSNDLIGKGKEFSYGAAAREGVSSFFKYIGGNSAEEELVAKKDEIMIEKREELVATAAAANPDVSDWMAPAAKPSASPTSVPRMGGGGLSGAGGIGGGGSRSSGGVSRFGEGSGLGSTKIGQGGAGETGTTEKGTLGALNRARSSLGEGLRSGSAATARAKWGSGFGEGSGKSGQMSYTGGGLVKLDTIKKGEVGDLKMAYAKKPVVPDATDFQRDEKAEAKDAGLQAAKAEAQKNAEAEAKKAAAQAALQAASNSMNGTGSSGNQRSNDRSSGSGGGGDVPDTVQNTAKNAIFSSTTQLAGGQMNAQDSTISYSKNSDGTYTATFSGTATISATGKTFPYVQEAKISSTGEIIGWTNK